MQVCGEMERVLLMTVREKHVVWMMVTILPIYAMGITAPGLGLGLLFLPLEIILFVAFFVHLLYSEKSLLWNFCIAFAFWLPGLGLIVTQPGTEIIAAGKVYVTVLSIGVIPVIHGFSQLAGRSFINRFYLAGSTLSDSEKSALRKWRFLWIGGAFAVTHLLLLLAFITQGDFEGLSGALFVSVSTCVIVLSFSVLYVERSFILNGVVACLFWMPVMGWWWVISDTEETFYDVFYVVVRIGLVYACIQVLGRIFMNQLRRREQS